jgi:ankyrin repeat protein
VIAWDYGLSPLHLSILNGHLDIIELLVSEYGADVRLPVKLVEPGTGNARGAIMTIVLAMFLPTEKAKEVVKLLLELGASSSQGDMNRFSVLHYVVAQENSDILDVLLANDGPIAMSVLNNIGFTNSWGNNIASPLTTAVQSEHAGMVTKLLKLGAKPSIPFDDWIKTYLVTNSYAKSQTAESNMNTFRSQVEQPIVSAAAHEMGKTVQELLEYGADADTLEKTGYSLIQNQSSSQYQTGESLLDIIQKKLQVLREYKQPEKHTGKEPETLFSEEHYTNGLEEGTYQYWTALKDFQARKRSNEMEWKNYKRNLTAKSEDGVEEKKAAIAKLISELEKTEKSLIDAGAKPFYEMHPEISKPQQNNYSYNYKAPEPKPYETNLTFRVPDQTGIKKGGYIKLFEAAWSGDLETVKSMTLAPWVSGEEELPALKIAVQDGNGFSPFSIAVKRGHLDLAKKIVEICIAQYHEDGDRSHRERWNMRTSDSDDEPDDDDDLPPIFSELVSDKFTVDDLGEVSNVVKSDVLPLTMIEWPCAPQRFLDEHERGLDSQYGLFEHAVSSNDMELLKFMTSLAAEQQTRLAEEPDDRKSYTINRSVFYSAIKLGRTEMLAEMIKTTGVGIPLNKLIEKSGVEIKEKPKYYQGLSVGGKKRADWAQAPGGNVTVVEERIPPLLQAAHMGSIESVEWLMSDAPMRRYKEFAEKNKSDKRIKILDESNKGFDKTIGKWLNTNSKFL